MLLRFRRILRMKYIPVWNSVLIFTTIRLIFIISRVSPSAKAMSAEEYHELLERLVIINEKTLTNPTRSGRKRDTQAKHFHKFRGSKYLYNSIAIEYHGESKCPTKQEIMARRSFQVCPAYFVSEYDPNRIPSVIFQVRCKCLTCHGPLHKYRHRKCTPLFRFINAYRVVEKSSGGKNIYAKVREPVSYSCQCTKDVLGAKRTFIPP